jgi:ubiquinone/menaquinone biosynthesis C-methylase UbiE
MNDEQLFKSKEYFFDRWAPSYDNLLPSVFYQAIHQRLLEYVALADRAAILDLGCGTGRLIDRLLLKFPTIQATGLDLSAEMLRQARQNKRDRARVIYISGNAENLPFAIGQFDAVFNTISFLHYPDPERVLSEIQRVLKPGGTYYLADFASWWWDRREAIGRGGSAMHFYPPALREELGKKVGLDCLGHVRLLGPVMLTRFRKKAGI